MRRIASIAELRKKGRWRERSKRRPRGEGT
jgi:hypothetical protein